MTYANFRKLCTPLKGNKEYKFCLPEEGILSRKEILKIGNYLRNLKIDSKKEFDGYFDKLPEELKDNLFWDSEENEKEKEFHFNELKGFLNFFYDCEKNKSWIYLNIS